jgi:hypothetical protein
MDHVIPVASGVPHQRQRTHLDGVEYVLELHWSEREAQWYLTLRDRNAALICGPMKIVVNWPILLARRGVAGVPPGELLAADGRETPADPRLDELGDVVQLLYRDTQSSTPTELGA